MAISYLLFITACWKRDSCRYGCDMLPSTFGILKFYYVFSQSSIWWMTLTSSLLNVLLRRGMRRKRSLWIWAILTFAVRKHDTDLLLMIEAKVVSSKEKTKVFQMESVTTNYDTRYQWCHVTRSHIKNVHREWQTNLKVNSAMCSWKINVILDTSFLCCKLTLTKSPALLTQF